MPMDSNRTVSFSLGGMAFEYNEEKNQINIKSMGFHFAAQPVSFSIMTEFNFSMTLTATASYAMIQSATPQPDELHKLEKYQLEMQTNFLVARMKFSSLYIPKGSELKKIEKKLT